ncbi:Os10g0159167 [Oryza sativa Japonica Group]|uniref:Os10g0159167 protein n=1 Tax=Oryza sativa subsp. japonica TaxID=39947 RepID=A0A0P0XRV0_ORYSJ|nr:Os10g0159167 [Oryza sativa Japonica Group]
MVSSTMAGVDLPTRRLSPSPLAYKRDPRLPPLSPHTAALSLSSLHGRRAALFLCRHRRNSGRPSPVVGTSSEPTSPPSASPLPPLPRPPLRRARRPREQRRHRRPEASHHFFLTAGNTVDLSPPRLLYPAVPEDQLFIAVDVEDFVSDKGKSYLP